MFTGNISHAGTLVAAIVVLTGAAILRGSAAAADPNQDDQFLALLDQKGIPALSNVPSLIATAHKVCHKLDGGTPANDLVNEMVTNAYRLDPPENGYAPGRLARTEARFISASVQAYCPYNQGKIVSLMANPTPRPNEPRERVAGYTHNAVNGIMLTSLIGAVPSGEITPPNPPQIPTPPPMAQTETPPMPIVAPPRPKQPPPPPQQPPPPLQQPEPPAEAPQPGAGAGTGGSGGGADNGGGGPAEPSPMPAMPPGFVRLAP